MLLYKFTDKKKYTKIFPGKNFYLTQKMIKSLRGNLYFDTQQLENKLVIREEKKESKYMYVFILAQKNPR